MAGRVSASGIRAAKIRCSIKALLAGLLIALLAPASAFCEIPPPSFDLDHCSGNASLIVQGRLESNGIVRVDQVLHPNAVNSGTLSLQDGTTAYQSISRVMNLDGGSREVVVFYTDRSESGRMSIWGLAGVVGLLENRVYTVGGGDEMKRVPPQFRLNPEYSRDSFMQALRAALDMRSRLETILAMPRSAERAEKLIDFQLLHSRANGTQHGKPGASFVAPAVVRGMRPVDPSEQKTLVQRINQAQKSEEAAELLELAGTIPLDAGAFGELSKFLDRTQFPIVRRAAMRTLSQIDPAAAAENIVPYLTPMEPELETAITSLGGGSYPSSEPKLSMQIADALLNLAKTLPEGRGLHGGVQLTRERYALIHQIRHYAHPRAAVVLYDIAMSNDTARDTALSELMTITGLKWSREEKEKWDNWWQKAQPILSQDYDLSTEAGRAAWEKAYDAADESVRRVLVRLWAFQDAIDEELLLKSSTARPAPGGATAALMELWRVGRLSPSMRHKLFESYFFMEITQGTIDPANPNYRNVYIWGTPLIPFPPGTEIKYSYSIVMGGEPNLSGKPENSVVLEGRIPILLGSLGRPAAAQPTFKALIQIRQMDNYGTRQEIWSMKRTFGPLTLRGAAQDN